MKAQGKAAAGHRQLAPKKRGEGSSGRQPSVRADPDLGEEHKALLYPRGRAFARGKQARLNRVGHPHLPMRWNTSVTRRPRG